jgi:hypothetical protein
MLNYWIGLSYEAARLGWEAQNVIMLRMMKLGIGGAPAQKEANRMMKGEGRRHGRSRDRRGIGCSKS